MIIAIIGSRNLKDEWVLPKLNFLRKFQYEYQYESKNDLLILSGGAKGVDTCVKNYCDSWKIPLKIIRPINPSNKLDYLFRNVEIITLADKIIAFWDGKSKGTKFVIDYAKARDKDVEVIRNDDRANKKTT